jgi:hypothetical protein
MTPATDAMARALLLRRAPLADPDTCARLLLDEPFTMTEIGAGIGEAVDAAREMDRCEHSKVM